MKPFSSEERYQELAEKWLNNTISQEEKMEFAQWYNSGQDKDIQLPENYVGDEKELEARIYYEIDNVVQEQFLGGHPDKSWSLIVNTHYTRLSKINLVERQT